jgi:hypothetical protein
MLAVPHWLACNRFNRCNLQRMPVVPVKRASARARAPPRRGLATAPPAPRLACWRRCSTRRPRRCDPSLRARRRRRPPARLRPPHSCAVCGSFNAAVCARCRLVGYCGAEHQRTDWPAHMLVCHKCEFGVVPVMTWEQRVLAEAAAAAPAAAAVSAIAGSVEVSPRSLRRRICRC